MHMADALISPAVGGTMWAATAAIIGYSSKKVREDPDDQKIPLMAVVGAFIFAAQMINFTIPGTGSSGHIGGGMILAILLGPYAAFLAMASVLAVQAMFFADGGLLALGCNIFNLGFFPCFIAYPLIYKNIVGKRPGEKRLFMAATLSAVVALQLGAFSVVLQTVASGVSELPFATFAIVMQPIHLAIGLLEGLATTAVVLFVWKARPEILNPVNGPTSDGALPLRNLLIGFLAAAVVAGGILSWFASVNPDGLEWSIFKTTDAKQLQDPQPGAHAVLDKIQQKIAVLPDYGLKSETDGASGEEGNRETVVDAGKSLSSLVGGALTLLIAGLVGVLLKHRKKSIRT